MPVVLVDRTLPEPGPTDAVLVDNAGGATSAARHLLELGHRTIAHIAGPLDTTPGAERHDAFVAACADAGVDVIVDHGEFRVEGGYQAAMRLFGRSGAPTAVLAANNLMTVGLLARALHDLGLGVPDAVSVIGFDDHLLADLLDPPLTVIDRATETQGAVATRMLLARLQRGDVRRGSGRATRDPTDRSSLNGGAEAASASDRALE